MASVSDLADCASDLAVVAEALAAELRRDGVCGDALKGVDGVEISEEIYDSRRAALLGSLYRIQAMLRQPSDFLRGLALHTQVLAGLQWLCEFQVLACIPLDDAVAFRDVADICGVPENQLCRVTRLMATAGFLREPRAGHVGHSPLSAQFVTEPALLDAAMFLAGTAAPAALKMPLATKRFATSDRADQSAYAAAFDTTVPLASVFELQPRLQRQFDTFLSFVTSDDVAGVRDVVMRVDWASLGNATVVDVGAPSASTAIGLAGLFPALQFVVQTYEPSFSVLVGRPSLTSPPPSPLNIPAHLSGKITLQKRVAGTTQFVRSAAVYMLHLPSPSPSLPWPAVSSHAVSELTAHLDVLRSHPGSRLVVTALVLPPSHPQGPGQGGTTADTEMEAAARVRDLSLLQLANGKHPEKAEVVDLLHGIRDGAGGFVLTDEIGSSTSAFVAWEVQYQAYGEVKH